MSGADDGAPPEVEPPIGYGRPPAAHQFKPGRSGNPKGRPRTKKAKVDTAFGTDAIGAMILAEAYRPVTVREGDRAIELPAIQAVLRAMGVSAMKGNRFAQKSMTEIVQKIEREHYALRQSYFETMCEFKWKWEARFEEADRLGEPRPVIVPHPDDIVIETKAGKAYVNGPFDDEDKRHWDQLQARASDADHEITQSLKLFRSKRARDVELRAYYYDDIITEHRLRLMLRFGAPDETTRRAINYKRPTVDDIDALKKANISRFPLFKDASPDDVERAISTIESYERWGRRKPS